MHCGRMNSWLLYGVEATYIASALHLVYGQSAADIIMLLLIMLSAIEAHWFIEHLMMRLLLSSSHAAHTH